MFLESRVEIKQKTLARCLNQYRPVFFLFFFCDLDFGGPDIGFQTVKVKK